MKRTDLIISKLVRRLKAVKYESIPRTEELLLMLDDAQYEIAEEGLAIKGDIPFVTEANEEIYDLGTKIYRIRQFFRPSTWNYPVEIVNNEEEWNKIIHSRPLQTQPCAVTVWDNKLRFFPTPTITGEEGRLWLYLYPSKVLNEGTDPEVGTQWDACLEFHVLDQLLGKEWTAKYTAELQRLQAHQLREILSPVRISNFTDGIGF